MVNKHEKWTTSLVIGKIKLESQCPTAGHPTGKLTWKSLPMEMWERPSTNLKTTVTSTSEERERNGIQWDTRGHLHCLCTIFISSSKKMSTFVRSYWWHPGRLYMTCSSLCLKFFILAFTFKKRKINLNREFWVKRCFLYFHSIVKFDTEKDVFWSLSESRKLLPQERIKAWKPNGIPRTLGQTSASFFWNFDNVLQYCRFTLLQFQYIDFSFKT